jgi:Ca-activated chloride channel homolog
MMDFSEFHFLRPDWFWSLPVLVLIAVLWLRRSLSSGNWEEVCDQRLLPYILERKAGRRSRLPWLFFLVTALLSLIALAGPTWQRLPMPVYRNESALVIVLDLSRSMDAADIQPSRLGRARFKIADILQLRKDGLTALVVYSEAAHTVTPLTDDQATIANQLPALETSIMPAQGSRASAGIERAGQLLNQSGNPSGNILLMADGVDPKAFAVAEELSRKGYRLFVLGVGSEDGAPIPKEGGGFIKGSAGNIVLSRLEPQKLDSLAATGGGFYQDLTPDDRDIRSFLRAFERSAETPRADPEGKQVDQWIEAGPWLLFLVLPIAAFAFRRGYLMVVLFVSLPFPQPVHAWQWKDLWQTPDQQAYRAFEQGDYKRAAKLFEDPAWKAASEYSTGQYQQALETLDQTESAGTSYNKGNALARTGRFPEALQAYDKALEEEPRNEDARYNRDLIKKIMEQQESAENQSADSNGNAAGPQSSSTQDKNAESKDSEPRQTDQQPAGTDSADRAEEPDDFEPNDQQGSVQENQPADAKDMASDESESMDDPGNEGKSAPQANEDGRVAEAESTPEQELQQANEQWLRRIPDDPGGLLRRKFKYQYQQANPRRQSGGEFW